MVFPINSHFLVILKLVSISIYTGWWMAQHNGKSGWIPAAYLQQCTMVNEEDGTPDDAKSYLGFVVDGEYSCDC